jgi:hypothetical protein
VVRGVEGDYVEGQPQDAQRGVKTPRESCEDPPGAGELAPLPWQSEPRV